MSLLLYNTLSRKKEEFVPIHPPKVKMYCCGPTVYDLLHIGNFRGAVFFNFLRQWLEHKGYQVVYAYNFTDVDDKILNRAQKENKTMKEIADKYIAEFKKDFKALKLKEHDYNPKATLFISEMIKLITTLLKRGVAYQVDGDVFFSIESYASYGKLSRRKKEELISGARVAVDRRKKHLGDFALWKSCAKGEPGWDTPWGYGRPGWHLECTTMIFALLGEHIDIHGGGTDLIFPHHENELAQAEGAMESAVIPVKTEKGQGLVQGDGQRTVPQPVSPQTLGLSIETEKGQGLVQGDGQRTVPQPVSPQTLGLSIETEKGQGLVQGDGQRTVPQPVSPQTLGFVRYWVHNNMFTFGGEKMAKSTGNVSVMRDFLQKYNGEIFKYLVLSSHYRSLTEVSKKKIGHCIQALSRIYTFLEKANTLLNQNSIKEGFIEQREFEQAEKDIIQSLNDDLNTPAVLSIMFGLIRQFNDIVQGRGGSVVEKQVWCAYHIKGIILKYGKIMSLFQENPSAFLRELSLLFLRKQNLSQEEIDKLVFKRSKARVDKNFKLADQIRLELLEMGIEVQDKAEGTKWTPSWSVVFGNIKPEEEIL